MTFRAKIHNGALVTAQPLSLPDGMDVEVDLRPVEDTAASDAASQFESEGPTLLERMKDVVGIVKGQPPDSALNIDNYLYGAKRR